MKEVIQKKEERERAKEQILNECNVSREYVDHLLMMVGALSSQVKLLEETIKDQEEMIAMYERLLSIKEVN